MNANPSLTSLTLKQLHNNCTAGPREDIVVPLTVDSNCAGGLLPLDEHEGLSPPNGFLATSLQEFTDAIMNVGACVSPFFLLVFSFSVSLVLHSHGQPLRPLIDVVPFNQTCSPPVNRHGAV